YSDAGALVWEARGLTCRQVILDGAFHAESLQDAVYESRWQFQPRALGSGTWRTAAYMPQPRQIAAQLQSLASDLRYESALLERQWAFEQAVRPVCAAYAWSAFCELSGGTPFPIAFSADALDERLQIAPKSRALLRHCLEWLAEDGLLRRDGANWQLASAPPCEPPKQVWSRVLAEYPDCLTEMLLIARCCGEPAPTFPQKAIPTTGTAPGAR